MYRREVRRRVGSRFPGLAPICILRCKDGWWGLNALPAFWRALAAMIERPDLLEDPRFTTMAGRWDHVEALEALIEEATRDWTRAQLMERGATFRIPLGAALSIEELLHDPHLRAREFWRPVGELQVPGCAFQFVGEGRSAEPPGAEPGAHTAEVRAARTCWAPTRPTRCWL